MEKHLRDAQLYIVDGGEDQKSAHDIAATKQPGFNKRMAAKAGR